MYDLVLQLLCEAVFCPCLTYVCVSVCMCCEQATYISSAKVQTPPSSLE